MEVRFDQYSFTQGEVDPKIQSRADWEGYYKSCKYARNVQIIPQGGIQRRWGTIYVDTCSVGNPDISTQFELCTLLIDDPSTYLLLSEPASLKIYFENKLVATLSTSYVAPDIPNLRFSQVENRLIITNLNYRPAQLIRSSNAPNAITGVDTTNMYINITTALTVGNVYPIQFTTGGALPVTSPVIFPARNYFANAISANSIRIYDNAADAIANTNYFIVTANGTGNVIVRNTWAISNITFINVPSYDFSGGYSAITFTPSATSGAAVTITLSAPLANLTNATFAGGLFTGNGGSLRIVSVADTTHFTGYTIDAFADTNAIQGALAFLGEPAWSDIRGWPKYSTFFQNRLVFAGSYSLPNGIWLSAVNAPYDFDDSQDLDDEAIGWYPAGGSLNLIVGLTSGRSLLVHSNNGTFSTPLLNEQPVTPRNFTLTEQNKFAVKPIQPIFIDNQIIFVDTASNVINMIWDISTSAFNTNNISVMSSSLINTPVDTTSFYEPKATDGFYALFVNGDGTLAVYQTLHEQGIGAWSLMNTSVTINDTEIPSQYLHIISSDTRCWVLARRTILVGGVQTHKVFIEEISFNVLTDAAKQVTFGSPTTTVTGLGYLEGCTVNVKGDGYVLADQVVTGGQITTERASSIYEVGLNYVSQFTPLPIALPQQFGVLYKPKHIRNLYIRYYQSIGVTVLGYDLAIVTMQHQTLGEVPDPKNGVFEVTPMQGWNSFEADDASDINIMQTNPLPMTILGLSYVVEV